MITNNDNFLNNQVEESLIIYSAKELISFLICPICKGLVRQPILGCQKCQTFGCGTCINNWEKQGTDICLNGCVQPNFGKVLNPILYTMLDYIMIKCPNSQNSNEYERCREVLTYKNVYQHLEICEYKVYQQYQLNLVLEIQNYNEYILIISSLIISQISKCMYSSCQKKNIRRLIRDHEETCTLKNPSIYFIFRDPEKLPIKIEISMDLNINADQFLEILEKYVGVMKKNIELVIIKNHEIIEYIIKRNFKLKYFATHEGFLFGFQKYHDEKDITFSHPKICQLHIEVMIVDDQTKFRPDFLKFYNHDIQRCPSFTRIFHFQQYTNFKKIHIEIYKVFRSYIKNWVQKQENIEQFKDCNFNINKEDHVVKEYEQLRNQSTPPFALVFGQNMKMELPYNSKYFHDFYKLDQLQETQFCLAIVFSQYIDVSALRLNRCLEAPFKIEVTKEQPQIQNYTQ